MNYLLRSVHNSGFIHIAHFNFDHFETSYPRQNDRKLQDNKGHATQGIMAHNNDVPFTRDTILLSGVYEDSKRSPTFIFELS